MQKWTDLDSMCRLDLEMPNLVEMTVVGLRSLEKQILSGRLDRDGEEVIRKRSREPLLHAEFTKLVISRGLRYRRSTDESPVGKAHTNLISSVTGCHRVMKLAMQQFSISPIAEPAPRSRSNQTSCRKSASRRCFKLRGEPASQQCPSWCSLQSDATGC